uniref:FimV/HubP family polar landmark protein n=1 Tax=Vibrio sp. H11 TaxID=2565928 RepID=UPI0023EF5128
AQAEPPESVEADEGFAFDDLELPEYSEADALADSVAEPEAEAQPESSAQAEQPESAEADEAFAFDDLELPEYSEADALADSEYEAESEFIFDGEEDEALSDELFAELEQSFAEDGMGGESEPEPHGESENTPSPQPDKMAAREEFDEDALNALLDEQPHSDGFAFDGPIDAQTIDSAGMDIEAMLDMGGEDWNGFSLTADQQADIVDDVPEEELAAWHPEIQNQQPEVETENWGKQEDIMDFDPQQNQFMTIDELMAQVEREDMGLSPDDEELKLDVGLNEFPDVIGDISDIDVDSNAEAAGKLDLAQIYMEMNDHKGAVKLLEEAIVDGNDDIRRQAKHLIDVINGRA